MDVAIRTEHLTKRYGTTAAVDDVSLRVGEGEIYAFLGLNGAGKTTTIRMLLGMIRPSAGTAELLGTPVRAGARALWAQVGYLVETPSAYPDLTVRENLLVTARLRLMADTRAVDHAIERFGLGRYAGARASTLSLGNAQRLGLAKALLHEPRLLLLDEPANGLDPAGVVEVRELLRELASRQGVTVFMSSHILAEVARLATRIGIIHAGRLVEELSADELERRCRRRLVVDALDRQAAREALASAGFAVATGDDGLIETGDAAALAHPERIAQLLVREGAPPTRLGVEQEDLEAHFLRLVGAAREAAAVADASGSNLPPGIDTTGSASGTRGARAAQAADRAAGSAR
jgi:ABC-2 type transport system ATP-binding protein